MCMCVHMCDLWVEPRNQPLLFLRATHLVFRDTVSHWDLQPAHWVRLAGRYTLGILLSPQ